MPSWGKEEKQGLPGRVAVEPDWYWNLKKKGTEHWDSGAYKGCIEAGPRGKADTKGLSLGRKAVEKGGVPETFFILVTVMGSIQHKKTGILALSSDKTKRSWH